MLYIVICRDLKTGEDKEVPCLPDGSKMLSKERAWTLARMMENIMHIEGIRQPFWATPVLDV